jgi:hypothetical protein
VSFIKKELWPGKKIGSKARELQEVTQAKRTAVGALAEIETESEMNQLGVSPSLVRSARVALADMSQNEKEARRVLGLNRLAGVSRFVFHGGGALWARRGVALSLTKQAESFFPEINTPLEKFGVGVGLFFGSFLTARTITGPVARLFPNLPNFDTWVEKTRADRQEGTNPGWGSFLGSAAVETAFHLPAFIAEAAVLSHGFEKPVGIVAAGIIEAASVFERGTRAQLTSWAEETEESIAAQEEVNNVFGSAP